MDDETRQQTREETRQERPLRSKRRERRATGAGDGPAEAAGLSAGRPTDAPGQTVRLTEMGDDGRDSRDLREAHTAAGPLVAEEEYEDAEDVDPPDGKEGEGGEEEEERYDSWPEWLADNWTTIGARLGVVALIFVVVLFVGTRIFGGGGDEEGAGSEAGNAPREGSGAGGAADGPAPRDAGELRVQVGDDGAVSVSLSASEVRPSGAEWSGQLKRSEGTATVSLAPAADTSASQASFTSVLSEDGARSWLGMIKDTATLPGMTLEAVQASDPGAGALEGRTPFLRGSYVVKADDGSFSASGSFEDTLLDESTVERSYDETYLAGGEPKRRTLSAEYRVSGDAGLLPVPAGYELPPEAGGSGAGG